MGTEKGFQRTGLYKSRELQNQSNLETKLQKVFLKNMVLVSTAPTASYYLDEYKNVASLLAL